MRRYAFNLLLLLCLTACRHQAEYPAVLTLADSLANVKPKDALVILNDMEEDMAHESKATQMYYRLLRIKAADKAYITHMSDSLILPIVDYYENGGDPSLLSEAYYYAGRVYRDLNDAPRAAAYFQKSINTTSAEKNPALYAQLGEIYLSQSLYSEALNMYHQAFLLDSIAKDTISMVLDLRDIAFTHRVQHQYDKALHFYQQAESLSVSCGDDEMKSLITAQLAGLYNRMGKNDDAFRLINEALPHVGDADRMSLIDIYANILLSRGELKEAEEKYLNMAESNDLNVQLDAYNGLATIAGIRQQSGDYLHYFRLYKTCRDSLERVAATETVSRINAMFNYQLHEQENAELRIQNQRKQLFIICSMSIFLLLVIGIIAYFQFRRAKMKNRLAQVERMLREHLEEKTKNEQKRWLEEAVKDSEVMHQLETKIVDGKPLTETDVSAIEQMLNELCPSFLPLLEQLGSMTPMEHQVCLLLKLNLTPVQISSLVLRDKSSVASIRRRLFKKITGQDGTPGDLDNIIHSL